MKLLPQKIKNNIGKILLGVLIAPIVLFLILTICIYIPPVQRFVVNKLVTVAEEKTGIQFKIDHVGLAFPLDLSAENVIAVEKNDTLLHAKTLRLDVKLLPLFKGKVKTDGIELYVSKIDSKDYIPNTHLSGAVGELKVKSTDLFLKKEDLSIHRASLKNADLAIAVTDSAYEDTITKKSHWNIKVDQLTLQHVKTKIALPQDLPTGQAIYAPTTIWIAADLQDAKIVDGCFDIGKKDYRFKKLAIKNSALAFFQKGKGGVWTRLAKPMVIPNDKARNEKDSIRAQYQYSDAMPALVEWQPNWVDVPTGRYPKTKLVVRPFDAENIALSGIQLHIDGLHYDSVGQLTTQVQQLALVEHSGLSVNKASSKITMADDILMLPDLSVEMAHSSAKANIYLPFSALKKDGKAQMKIALQGQIALEDLKPLLTGREKPKLLTKIPKTPLRLSSTVEGTMGNLRIPQLQVNWKNYAILQMKGHLADLTSSPAFHLNYTLQGEKQLFSLLRTFVPSLGHSVDLPRHWMAKGTLDWAGNEIKTTTNLSVGKGSAVVKAVIDLAKEKYQANTNLSAFPLQNFLPGMNLSAFTGKLHAQGRTFDVLSGKAIADVQADIKHFYFNHYNLAGIKLTGNIDRRIAHLELHSNNELLEGNISLHAFIQRQIKGRLEGQLSKIDFHKIGLAKDSLAGGGNFAFEFTTDKQMKNFELDGSLHNMFFLEFDRGFTTNDIYLSAGTRVDTTHAFVRSGDLTFNFGAKGNIDRLMPKIMKLTDLVVQQAKAHHLNQHALRKALPMMTLQMNAAKNNPLSNFLHMRGYQFKNLLVDFQANPTDGITGKLRCDSISTGSFIVDKVRLNLKQEEDGLSINGLIKNDMKYNPNRFTVSMDGQIEGNMGEMRLQFFDKKGVRGVDLGARMEWLTDGLQLSLYPEHPVLAYRNFTINQDNYIFLGNHKQIRANVDLLADDGTGLKLFSMPNDSVNDLTLTIKNLHLGELARVSSSIPQMGGALSGSVHLYDDHKHLSCMGDLNIEHFAYQDARIGDLAMSLIYLPKENGEHVANVLISSNDHEILSADGSYSDATQSLDIKGEMMEFPLSMANGFLAGNDIALKGIGKGKFAVTGKLDKPIINGTLETDSAHIYSDVYGFNLKLAQEPIEIRDSHLLLKNFKLYSSGAEPLVIDGELNMNNMSNMAMNLNISANNFELINAEKSPKAMVYGKMFVDYDGTIRGTMNNLSIRGQLDILGSTNMYYVMKDSPLSMHNRLEGLVEFVDFADSAVVKQNFEPESSFDMAMGITIGETARFHCLLTPDGTNYVDLNGGGNLMFRITQQGDMRLSGRITAQSGEMKYELPIIPLRTFNITPESYVEFTGNPMNPTLNIAATEHMKVIVNQDNQQVPVNFLVGLKITQPVDKMNLEFTIAAPQNLTVQNELQSMSPEQRNKIAVGMMATGMYITDLSQGTGGLKANNALNAFLQTEIQNIAGRALKSVDISLGVDPGTSMRGTQTTDYSFQFAKHFWNNRVNVIIGGRISAGVEADNRAESIINNVSVEYRINKNASRFVRIFYDRNQQDPLEGLLTNTGIGYSMRRKTEHFGDLFIFWRPVDEKKKKKKK